MIRKMRSEDKKTYMEMAREFYHSDAVSRRFVFTFKKKYLGIDIRAKRLICSPFKIGVRNRM